MRKERGTGLGSRIQQMRQKRKERKKEQEKQTWSEDAFIAEKELAKEVEKELRKEASREERKITHGKNQWKASKVGRVVVALGLCAAMVTGAFSGVRMVGTARKMWYMDARSLSTNYNLETSENFNWLLDGYLQLFELYTDIGHVIAPKGAIDYNTVLLEGEDKSYTLKDLCKAEGNGYDYRYYVDNYIENLQQYSRMNVSLLELTQEIRSLRNMAVIENGEVYYSPELSETLTQKEKEELNKEVSRNHLKNFSGGKTELPAFEGMEELTEKIKLSIPEKDAEIESKSEYQDWIIGEYPEYAKGYMLLQIVDAYKQDFQGEIDGVEAERYETIFKNLYKGECFLASVGNFYEYDRGENTVTYISDYTGEEHSLKKDQIVYNKKGKSAYAKDVQVEFGYSANVYSMNKEMYAEQLKKEANEILEELPKENIPWSAPVLPYSLKEAQDYANFLVKFYAEIEELLHTSRFDCYYESEDLIIKSNEGWAYLKRKIEKMQEDASEEEESELLYAYYNSNGAVFDTNLYHTYFGQSGECYEFLSEMGRDYNGQNNFICAFTIDLSDIKNSSEKEHFTQLYQEHQGEQKIYTALEVELKQEAKGFFISFVFILLAMLLLSVMTGHEKNSDTIVLKWYDRIWLEIVLLAFGFILMGFLALCWEGTYWYAFDEQREEEIFQLIVWGLAAIAVVMSGILLSLIKRRKAKKLLKTSVICSNFFRVKRGLSKIGQGTKKLVGYIREFPVLIRYVLVFGVNVFGAAYGFFYIAGDYSYYGFANFLMLADVLGVIILDGLCAVLLIKNAVADERIRVGAEKIAGGELSYQIEVPSGISKEQAELVKVINSIGEGLEKAVEESVRSERMKTELITNVSHDIKTPLTSVINYVDLLKRENIESERAQEYLRILDQKSQRLKVLIEDLVEASKASSGAIDLQISRLNFNELVNQTTGEFEEKFQAAGLTILNSISDDIIVFEGDGRRVYRILENLYGNVAKYAMPGTRVYTELYQKENQAVFTIKNISKEPLNIKPEELTERFVRGEQSRTTEGSGLGLSIAKSLTERMNGSFEIHMDGDLFRVTISFPVIQ